MIKSIIVISEREGKHDMHNAVVENPVPRDQAILYALAYVAREVGDARFNLILIDEKYEATAVDRDEVNEVLKGAE